MCCTDAVHVMHAVIKIGTVEWNLDSSNHHIYENAVIMHVHT